MVMSIIIPVYNEENAIKNVIKSCIDAKDIIKKETGVIDVEIIVVDDGSKDNSVKIVSGFNQVKLVKHEKNKGYGAALMTGFKSAKGEVIGFLDGDGTCDPISFKDLYKKIANEGFDLVIGSRLNKMSSMPKTRKLGNLIFAGLINIFGGASITDSASGIRLFKKDVLKILNPLPMGLSFTPAMTSHAIFGKSVRTAEVPIVYKERLGKSKLSVVKDGLRFFRIILEIATLYAPFKIFGTVSFVFFVIAIIYGILPVLQYIRYSVVYDYMIYRIFTVFVLIIVGLTFMSVGVICEQIMYPERIEEPKKNIIWTFVRKIMLNINMIVIGILIVLAGILLNLPVIKEYITIGTVSEHWSRVITGGFLVIVGTQLFTLGIMESVIYLFMRRKQQ